MLHSTDRLKTMVASFGKNEDGERQGLFAVLASWLHLAVRSTLWCVWSMSMKREEDIAQVACLGQELE
eukprot:1136350-Pelagomonas_calceolata.AAC.3